MLLLEVESALVLLCVAVFAAEHVLALACEAEEADFPAAGPAEAFVSLGRSRGLISAKLGVRLADRGRGRKKRL